jgi:hypothetical protein
MPTTQNRRIALLAALVLAATAVLLVVLLRAAPPALAAAGNQEAAAPGPAIERWLHVSVITSDEKGERVRVNVPISLARNVLALIHHGELDHGIIHINRAHMDDVDLRQLFKALKAAQEGEYVTVEQKDCNVRVSKLNGMMLVHVQDKTHADKNQADKTGTGKTGRQENVDVRMPLIVAEALFSAGPNELNVGAALEALARHGDMELVSVRDAENTVRIWMDTKNTSD